MYPLAIVVPAFKSGFLRETLESLARQTRPSFRVVVGDDAGPAEIARVCATFSDRLDLSYHRFESNLGGTSLTRQWDRCVRLTNAPWVMVLGDDDVLDPGCIASFLDTLDCAPRRYDVYRFDTRQIDQAGGFIRNNPEHPEVATPLEHVRARFLGRSSYASEYVFSRRAFDAAGGFVEFPLAWCSDDASWALFSERGGIARIKGPRVSWRLSGTNISSSRPELVSAKLDAILQYFTWLDDVLLQRLRTEQLSSEARLEGMRWFLSTLETGAATLPVTDAARFAVRLSRFARRSPLHCFLRIARIVGFRHWKDFIEMHQVRIW